MKGTDIVFVVHCKILNKRAIKKSLTICDRTNHLKLMKIKVRLRRWATKKCQLVKSVHLQNIVTLVFERTCKQNIYELQLMTCETTLLKVRENLFGNIWDKELIPLTRLPSLFFHFPWRVIPPNVKQMYECQGNEALSARFIGLGFNIYSYITLFETVCLERMQWELMYSLVITLCLFFSLKRSDHVTCQID